MKFSISKKDKRRGTGKRKKRGSLREINKKRKWESERERERKK